MLTLADSMVERAEIVIKLQKTELRKTEVISTN